MDVGEVRVADDRDFEKLITLIDENEGWKMVYRKNSTTVWTKSTQQTSFKMIKIKAVFKDILPSLLYDVVMDPAYRKTWDIYMLDSYDIGCLNPNNDIGYYAVRFPAPLKNRDFVLQRSWLDTGKEYLLFNHSVFHKLLPIKKGFIRGISFLTGFVIRPVNGKGCELNYVTQCDPSGSLPVWVINKFTQICAPKLVKKLQKASVGYISWKQKNNPNHKPWINPEQMSLPRIVLLECIKNEFNSMEAEDFVDESGINEDSLKGKDFFEEED
ncbi:START domain-containing protein 10-like [Tachypleus tridentatus]|uniref:START domain-containing protein 10-like n=1 Tax=Tachypleus tridentatus TaxID=6853 RepID=UPI003FD63DF2